MTVTRMQRLKGIIQPYDWGLPGAISELIGAESSGGPEAEYWLGDHPAGPARLIGSDRGLDEAVSAEPETMLGSAVVERFGPRLPFLFKILAAARPLSIQAHPSAGQARTGFDREEAAGIDRLAPDRNYRDASHKPELICALTPFEAKCGFRPVSEMVDLFSVLDCPALEPVRPELESGDGSEADRLSVVLGRLLRLPDDEARPLVGATVSAARAALERGSGDQRFGPELIWTLAMDEHYPGDIGVIVALLLNHVELEPGQAVFLEAGNLHCYLSGIGVELMANSDNVIRGGLTSKHIDVEELLAVVSTRPENPPVQSPEGAVHRFHSPVDEFDLHRCLLDPGATLEVDATGPEIVMSTEGEVYLRSATGGQSVAIQRGQAAFVPAGDGSYTIVAGPAGALVWRAACSVGNQASSPVA